ncbi:IS66 family insertion sequence element accessory protein TnpB [Microscilla marina]|uniref:Transposition helper protein n=1 Tax=Microscilla marina ATCC 23134 TaxID=313606 RepID=A1ZIJ4_MICM2|nr:IS66 family insertion sequence element accessory protein TnpB [Microscilla marina]EAY29862.1 transposition helper protein [Microscilla marina ATCC 23134]
MFSLHADYQYFLYQGICDMRKSFDGLCGLVLGELGREPTDGSVYVFLNRRRTHLKLLHWEAGGFVLYYKRLEKGCFSLPNKARISWLELSLMVEGNKIL